MFLRFTIVHNFRILKCRVTTPVKLYNTCGWFDPHRSVGWGLCCIADCVTLILHVNSALLYLHRLLCVSKGKDHPISFLRRYRKEAQE